MNRLEPPREACSVTCLGVTAADWERLGQAALQQLSLEVARKAFQRSENRGLLTLIDHLQVSGTSRVYISKSVTLVRPCSTGRY
ncbi:hypothetical protein JYU34_000754 [Plutella xylostella]|uniref:Uncharacterized protein n=1 Tax=Plutella xylostella TaxID=51655 RepID=A0ABQ7R8G4_PLUXY|nr:hypothetical protein JYU34_000754 [Plutella xylostella]